MDFSRKPQGILKPDIKKWRLRKTSENAIKSYRLAGQDFGLLLMQSPPMFYRPKMKWHELEYSNMGKPHYAKT
jgi:hypothetical protein